MNKKLILISGKARSGKNITASYLEKYFKKQNKTVSFDLFAKTVKDWAKEDFKALTDYLNTKNIKTTDDNFYEDKTVLTRILLQIYGTEIFRKRVDDNFWVKQLEKRILNNKSDITIITDCRFENELNICNDNDNIDKITIRVNRKVIGQDNHISETALDDWNNWDYIIDNNDTLRNLEYMTRHLVIVMEGKNGKQKA